MSDIENYKMLIDGVWCEAADGNTFDSFDPSTKQVWSRVPEATEEDVNRAVGAAWRAGEEAPWKTMAPTQRGHCLRRLGDLLAGKSEDLGRIETRDTGKMFKETRWQAQYISIGDRAMEHLEPACLQIWAEPMIPVKF